MRFIHGGRTRDGGGLPFVERIFSVQTDLSLLELGDPSHPLLRQLAPTRSGYL